MTRGRQEPRLQLPRKHARENLVNISYSASKKYRTKKIMNCKGNHIVRQNLYHVVFLGIKYANTMQSNPEE